MASKLELQVTAETGDAQKAVDSLGNSLKDLGSAAQQASQQAAAGSKAMFDWGNAADDVARAGQAINPLKSNFNEIAAATEQATKAAADSRSAFQRFGDSLREIGSNAVKWIKDSFSGLAATLGEYGSAAASALSVAFKGLASTFGEYGRAAGAALGAGLKAGGGALLAIVGVAAAAFARLALYANDQGKLAAQTYAKAFEAGLSVADWSAARAAFKGIVDTKNLDDAAAAFGRFGENMNAVTAKGEKAKAQLTAMFQALGGDAQEAARGGAALVEQLGKIAPAFQTLDALAQRDFLKTAFPKASMETLSQIQAALASQTTDWAALSNAVAGNAAAFEQTTARQKAMGEASAALVSALKNLGTAFLESSGLTAGWKATVGDSPTLIRGVADAINQSAQMVRSVPVAFSEAFTGISTAVSGFRATLEQSVLGVLDEVTSRFATFKTEMAAFGQSIWQPIVDGINWLRGQFDAFISYLTGAIDKVKSLWQSVRSLGGLIGGGAGGGGGAAPLGLLYSPADMPGLLRATTAAQPHESNLVGRAGVAPFAAANSNINTALSASIRQMANDWKNFAKTAEESSRRVGTANQQMTTTTRAASQAMSADLNQTAKAANDNSNAFQGLAKGLESWGQNASMAFVDAAMQGKDFGEVLQSVVKDLAKMIIKATLLEPLMKSIFGGGGGLGGLFGGLFGGGGAGLFSAGPEPFSLARAGVGVEAMQSNLTGRPPLSALTGAPAGDGVTNNIGSIAVNVSPTAAGGVVADTSTGQELGRRIDDAVRVVIVRESRPGGLLRQAA